ncbi:hypothetical protein [Cupriavidus sp. YR651]|uniref:hypothetical protein n=1 Tax=Cupriavidus sp. YR651 TaxID=1855315 RepID=UPI00115FD1BA|nr:hypothetical protein [Cupriavidus sp. YR651]
MTTSNAFPYPVVDFSDPRIVPGQQQALETLYLAGLREPVSYACGTGTDHEAITWDFAMQFQMMFAPHPAEPIRKSEASPPLPPGPRIFRIVQCAKVDPWRYGFTIELLVAIRPSSEPPTAAGKDESTSTDDDHELL